MASDSDTEEFFDATEDVNLSCSPAVSPTKPGTFNLQEEVTHSENNGPETGTTEPKQDDSKEIIDSIIEESQKSSAIEDSPSPENVETIIIESTSGKTNPVPLNNIPELVITETTLTNNDAEDLHHQEVEDFTGTNPSPLPDVSIPIIEQLVETSKIADIIELADGLKITEEEDRLPDKPDELEEDTEHKPKGSLSDESSEIIDQLAPAKPPRQISVEPDIVASTKKSGPTRPPPPATAPPPRPPPPARPAPPPRKKKGDENESPRSSGLEFTKDAFLAGGLLSTNAIAEGLSRDSQPSLDLASATSGDKVVTAQENGKAADGQLSSTPAETSGPQRPRSNSGRELTDEEILASVMIKNLDTGEEIPLSLAEEKLPTGINPLTLHIMRRTKEYVR